MCSCCRGGGGGILFNFLTQLNHLVVGSIEFEWLSGGVLLLKGQVATHTTFV